MASKEYYGVYPYSFSEAKSQGEVDEWKASYQKNVQCKEFIEKTLSENFNGTHLNADSAKKIVDEFGYHRTAFVLANTIREKESDGRFSDANKAWSHKFFIPKEKSHHNQSYAVSSHPAILDGLITQYQKLFLNLGMISKNQCVADTSKQDFEQKVIAIDPIYLSENHLSDKAQLWYATSSFGCNPAARGQAVFATCLSDGETARWSRYQVLGVVEEKALPNWAIDKLSEMGIETTIEKEKRLFQLISDSFTPQEAEDYIAITDERYGINTVAEEINFALAIKEGQYNFYYNVEDDVDLGKRYVDDEYPHLDGIISDNLDFGGIGADLIQEGGMYYESTFVLNYDDHPAMLYTRENLQFYLEKYSQYQQMAETQKM